MKSADQTGWRWMRTALLATGLAFVLLWAGWLAGDITPAHAQAVVITKTVGTTTGACAATQEITVTVGATVSYCFTIHNTSSVTYTEYVLRDLNLGRTFTSTATFPPGFVLVRTSTNYGALGPIRHVTSVTNTVLLTAAVEGGGSASAQSSARVNVAPPAPLNATVLISKTVGILPNGCATADHVTVNRGEPVYFCFTITNSGNVPFTRYAYDDTYLLQSYTTSGLFWPGSVITRTNTAFASLGPVTPTRTLTNVVTLVASGPYGVAESVDRAFVTVIQPPPEPSILVTKTVGLVSHLCATEGTIQVLPGTPVFFCVSIKNTGNTDFTRIDVKDDMQTTPPFFANFGQNRRLEPGQVITYTNARPELYFLGNVIQSTGFTNQVDVTVTGPNSTTTGGSTASVEMPVDNRVYLPSVER